MTEQELYNRVKGVFDQRTAADPRLRAIRKRIENGTATFADTAEYSEIVSKHLAQAMQENVPAEFDKIEKLPLSYVCEAILKEHYDAINNVLGEVQAALDEKNGIRLRAQKAAFPAERVQQVARSLMDPTAAAEIIRRRAGAPVENVAKSFHDDYMHENAKFRNDAGLKCYITRTTDGKCCKWCTSIAGRYVYGEEPQDVYRRHDNCGCTVIYENGRTRQDVWSKKSWEVKDTPKKTVKPTRLTAEQGREIEQRHLSQITRFSREQAEAVQARNLQYWGLTSGGGSGIMEAREAYGMNLVIDKFTPCLEDTRTGILVPTIYQKASKKELAALHGWNFDWLSKDLSKAEIYKLCLVDDDTIQGLVAVTDFTRDSAVYVDIAESAPHNLGDGKRFNGVGGHLFAIAAKISVEKNYGGFVFMDAKNTELVNHYRKTLGAVLLGRPHPYRMFIDEESAAKLLSAYTFEEG